MKINVDTSEVYSILSRFKSDSVVYPKSESEKLIFNYLKKLGFICEYGTLGYQKKICQLCATPEDSINLSNEYKIAIPMITYTYIDNIEIEL